MASSEKAEPFAQAMPEAHHKVCEAIDGALKFDMNDRFADAKAMQDVVAEAFTAVCGRPIEDPLQLSIGPDDAETLRKIIEQARPILEELERRSNDG